MHQYAVSQPFQASKSTTSLPVTLCSASERSPSTRSENGSTPVMSGSS